MAELIIKYKVIEEGKLTEKKRAISTRVAEICRNAFEGSKNLIEITIPEGIVRIGRESFCDCTMLNKITFPEELIEIDDYAFCGCASITELEIPKTVMKIGKRAFYPCINLKGPITISKHTSLGEDAFFGNYDKIRYYTD